MELFAGDIKFIYSPLSINDIRNDAHRPFKDIFLFLDEFPSEHFAIFLRNLARVINMNCIVSNTNSKIANVIGLEKVNGVADKTIWSIVFTNLNSVCKLVLNQEFKLGSSIMAIKKHRQVVAPSITTDPICQYLESLTSVLKRPGVAAYVALALKDFVAKELTSLPPIFALGLIADFVARSVGKKIMARKVYMRDSSVGHLAKIALSIPQTFNDFTFNTNSLVERNPVDDFKLDVAALCNQGKYLSDHLFYLSNPQQVGSCIFLTFSPAKH